MNGVVIFGNEWSSVCQLLLRTSRAPHSVQSEGDTMQATTGFGTTVGMTSLIGHAPMTIAKSRRNRGIVS